MKNSNLTKKLVRTAMIAAIYVVITLILAPISYMGVQFRISEVLVLLAYFDPFYVVGLTLGCFIANMLGPNGIVDVIFGTLATFIAVSLIAITAKKFKHSSKGLFIASLWPVIVNALIIGWELNIFFGFPLILSMIQVGFGEFVVVSVLGVVVFNILGSKVKIINRYL